MYCCIKPIYALSYSSTFTQTNFEYSDILVSCYDPVIRQVHSFVSSMSFMAATCVVVVDGMLRSVLQWSLGICGYY